MLRSRESSVKENNVNDNDDWRAMPITQIPPVPALALAWPRCDAIKQPTNVLIPHLTLIWNS